MSVYSEVSTNARDIYAEKMLHVIPEAPVIDRLGYILLKCTGQHVLNLGSASGGLHESIKAIAASVFGVDKEQPTDWQCDLDNSPDLSSIKDMDLIVAGEILEHLGNPGNLLKELRKLNCPLLITAPNAAALGVSSHLKRGVENINKDHVAWYSYHTLKVLLHRYGFRLQEFAWYVGRPLYAEGLIVLAN